MANMTLTPIQVIEDIVTRDLEQLRDCVIQLWVFHAKDAAFLREAHDFVRHANSFIDCLTERAVQTNIEQENQR